MKKKEKQVHVTNIPSMKEQPRKSTNKKFCFLARWFYISLIISLLILQIKNHLARNQNFYLCIALVVP